MFQACQLSFVQREPRPSVWHCKERSLGWGFENPTLSEGSTRKTHGADKYSSRNVRHKQPVGHALLEMSDHCAVIRFLPPITISCATASFLFAQSVIAVTDSLSVPPEAWQLRHPIWGQEEDMAPKPERHIVARLFAKATTKLGLATTIAALWLTALPIASAVAQEAPGQISAARAAALQECNRLAQRYPQHE